MVTGLGTEEGTVNNETSVKKNHIVCDFFYSSIPINVLTKYPIPNEISETPILIRAISKNFLLKFPPLSTVI